MIGQMRGHDFRKALENSGLLVFTDGPCRYSVRTEQAHQIACYELYDDNHSFRWGWIETTDGRRDYDSWLDFSIDIQAVVS